mgnify:CR=1 FL=1
MVLARRIMDDDRGRYIVFLAELAHEVAANWNVFRDVPVFQVERTIAEEVFIFFFIRYSEVRTHVFFPIHGGTGEEVFIVYGDKGRCSWTFGKGFFFFQKAAWTSAIAGQAPNP